MDIRLHPRAPQNSVLRLLSPLPMQSLHQQVAQLQNHVANLESDNGRLTAENSKLMFRIQVLRRSLENVNIQAPAVEGDDGRVMSPSSDSINSQDEQIITFTSIPSISSFPKESFSNSRHKSATFDGALQASLSTQRIVGLEKALRSQETLSQRLLIELLITRKQARVLQAKAETKATLVTMINNLHQSRKVAVEVSHEKSTKQLLVHLLAFRKTLASKPSLPPSPSPTLVPTSESLICVKTELDILRLSEAELRAEKDDLTSSLFELIPLCKHLTEELEKEKPLVNELILALVTSWKVSQQRRLALQKIRAKYATKVGISKSQQKPRQPKLQSSAIVDAHSRRRLIPSDRYMPPQRRAQGDLS